jgi:hypothetical protein
VYATDGDDTLGGSDIDLCLFKILKDRIHEAYGVDIAAAAVQAAKTGAGGSEEEAEDSANMCSAAAVHTKAEEIKKALTYVDEVQFNCTLPSGDKVCVAWSSAYVAVSCCFCCFIVGGYNRDSHVAATGCSLVTVLQPVVHDAVVFVCYGCCAAVCSIYLCPTRLQRWQILSLAQR